MLPERHVRPDETTTSLDVPVTLCVSWVWITGIQWPFHGSRSYFQTSNCLRFGQFLNNPFTEMWGRIIWSCSASLWRVSLLKWMQCHNDCAIIRYLISDSCSVEILLPLKIKYKVCWMIYMPRKWQLAMLTQKIGRKWITIHLWYVNIKWHACHIYFAIKHLCISLVYSTMSVMFFNLWVH